jgi:serine/threonine-protein kinase
MSSFRCLRCKSEIDSAYRACPHCGDVITEFTRQYTGNLLDGKYEIVERLGAGGMGQVFKATHKYLGATRVIKVVHPQIVENKDAQDRFLREARAATKVTHPNVAAMYDFAELPDGSHYMVSEFIDGENLAQKLRARGTLPPKEALKIMIQTLNGLEAIHKAGIVHRDVSPENIMLTRDGTVKIIDLGVAKVDDVSEVNATRTGIFVGKLRYASPEQLGLLNEGERIDGRADVYAAGMVLYELLTGRPPYEAKSPHEYFLIHTREQEQAISALPQEMPGSEAIQNALKKALARDRNLRFGSAREFASTLEEIERSLPNPQAMPTMALPLDGDETMRMKSQQVALDVDTLHRETLRTDAPPPPASLPSPPASSAAPPTILTPLPASINEQPAPPQQQQPQAFAVVPQARMESGVKPVWVVLFVILIAVAAIAGGGFLLYPKVKGLLAAKLTKTTDTAVTTTTMTIGTTTTAEPPKTSSASLTVVPTTTTAETSTLVETTTTQALPPLVQTTTTASPTLSSQIITPPIKKPPHVEPPPRNENVEPPQPAFNGESYIDGGDNPDANARTLRFLRNQVRGVKSVEAHGDDLVDALKTEMPNLEIVDNANVEIRFSGRFDVSRGIRTREGHGTVLKNGRVIFRWEMPGETTKFGTPPWNAFARTLSDAFSD